MQGQLAMLEKIAGLSREDAKAELVAKLDSEMPQQALVSAFRKYAK